MRAFSATVLLAAWMAGIGLLVHSMLSASLPPEDRGLVVIFLEVCTLASFLLRKGQEEPILASSALPKSKKYIAGIFRVDEAAPIFFAALAAALLFLAFGQPLLSIAVTSLAFFLLFDLLLAASRVHAISGFPKTYIILSVLSSLPLLTVGVLHLLGLTNGIGPWLVAYGFPGVIAAAAYFQLSRRKGWRSLWEDNTPLRDSIRVAGQKVLPGQIASFFSVRLERFLFPILSTTESLGLFAAVGGLLDGLLGPVRTWIEFSLSRWAGADGRPRRSLRIFTSSLTFVFALAAAIIPLALATQFLVDNVFPPSYGGAGQLIVPLALSTVLIGTYLFHRGKLIAVGRVVLARNTDLALMGVSATGFVFALVFGNLPDVAWARVAIFGSIALASGIALANRKTGERNGES